MRFSLGRAADFLKIYFFYAGLLAVIAGIILAHWADRLAGFSGAWLPVLFGLGFALAALAFILRREGIFLIILLLIGFLWGGMAMVRMGSFAVPVGEAVLFEGRVAEVLSDEPGYFAYLTPEAAGYSSFIMTGEDQNHWRGRLLVTGDNPQVKVGDRLRLMGVVRPRQASCNFDLRESRYLESRRIAAVVQAAPGSMRFRRLVSAYSLSSLGERLKERLFGAMETLPPLQQALLKGMGFGHTEPLGPGQSSILQQTGIMHIFAVSGLHVSYVVLLAGWFMNWLRRCLGIHGWPGYTLEFVGVLGPVLLFAAAVGLSPSVLRATIMAVTVLVCRWLGTALSSRYVLIFTAFMLLLWEPMLVGQAGFVLSFMATAGIVFSAELWYRLVPCKFLAVTLSAQLMIMPLVAYYFNTVSVVGLLISPLAAAAAGPVFVLLLLAVLLLPFGLAGIPLAGAGLLAELIYRGAELCAGLPGAFIYTARPGLAALVIYYCLVGMGLYFAARIRHEEIEEK